MVPVPLALVGAGARSPEHRRGRIAGEVRQAVSSAATDPLTVRWASAAGGHALMRAALVPPGAAVAEGQCCPEEPCAPCYEVTVTLKVAGEHLEELVATHFGDPHCVDVRVHRMQVHREPGGGMGADARAAARSGAERRGATKPTVLIVDENVSARTIRETLLQARGVAVRTVDDGAEACDLLCAPGAAVGVVVVALASGAAGMNGWELLRRLGGRFGGLPLPVDPRTLVIAEAETAPIARRLGADAVLCKPVAPRDFVPRVERLLDQSAAAVWRPRGTAGMG